MARLLLPEGEAVKHAVAALEGALLDAAVAKAEGHEVRLAPERPGSGGPLVCWQVRTASYVRELYPPSEAFEPSTEWAHGGPLVERERIVVVPTAKTCAAFYPVEYRVGETDPTGALDSKFVHFDRLHSWSTGPTPLIAAMRAYVASKFGEEVDLP